MANCNICNAQIEEGYICKTCAKQQREMNSQDQAGKFSFRSLVKKPATGANPPTPPNKPTSPTTPYSPPKPPSIPQSPPVPKPPVRPISSPSTTPQTPSQTKPTFVSQPPAAPKPAVAPTAVSPTPPVSTAKPFSAQPPTIPQPVSPSLPQTQKTQSQPPKFSLNLDKSPQKMVLSDTTETNSNAAQDTQNPTVHQDEQNSDDMSDLFPPKKPSTANNIPSPQPQTELVDDTTDSSALFPPRKPSTADNTPSPQPQTELVDDTTDSSALFPPKKPTAGEKAANMQPPPESTAIPPTVSGQVNTNEFKISAAAPTNEKPASLVEKKATNKPEPNSVTEQELQEEVFNSDETGYGDEELEIMILAGIMKDSFLMETLKGKGLIAGLFSTTYTRAIFKSVVSLRENTTDTSALDKIVIKNNLKQTALWNDEVNKTLDRILNQLPPALDQALRYLDLMKEQALKRKLKEVSSSINSFIEHPDKYSGETLETFTNKVISNVRNIQKAKSTKRINLVREEMKNILTDIDKREIEGEIEIIGYSFEPMHYLNIALSGFRKGFMYAIAGAPRRGKTTFTLELATRVATLNKIPVLFFTYEQTKKNLAYRLLAKESRLNPDTLQRKKIRSDMIVDAKFLGGWKKMEDYMKYFYIVEATKEDTVDRIRSYAYNVMQDFNTEDIMIFIDYIQKMPLSRDYMDEKFKVEEISTELKALSIELNNPIMTISSLSKDGCMIDATSDAERPTMYHCKGSGDLEYDLDCAMIQAKDWGDTKELHQQLQQRAEELGKDVTRVPKVDVVNLYLDKNRDAPEGIHSTLQYLFFIEDNKFIELGPKFDDDRYRFSKIEELVDKLIQDNFIIFYDKPKDNTYDKGRVSIKLKNF